MLFVSGLIAVVLILLIAMTISLRKLKTESSGHTGASAAPVSLDAPDRMARARRAQDFLGFEEILGDAVRLDVHRFRAFVEVEPVNFYLMTTPEQAVLVDGFRNFLDGLRFPVQIFVGSVPLDLSEHLTHLQRSLPRYTPELQEYGAELAGFTQAWVHEYAPITKKYVIVVSYDFVPNPRRRVKADIIQQQALQELDIRVHTVIESLARAKLAAHRMGEDELIAFLYQVFNRSEGAALAARNLITENVHSIYVTAAADALPEETRTAHAESREGVKTGV